MLYGIDGDEFVVILEKDELKCYEELFEQFQEINGKDNDALPAEIKVFVAYGVAVYNKLIHKPYQDVFEQADEKIYRNKIQMKRDEKSRFM